MHWPALRGMVHTMNKATFSAIRLFFAALVLALGACGGGGDEEEGETPTPSLDCQARPELCR